MKKSIMNCLSCAKDFSYSLYGTICPHCGRDQGLPELKVLKATLPPVLAPISSKEDNEEFQRLQAVVTRVLSQPGNNLAQRAVHLVQGPRRETYGDPKSSFEKVAAMFNLLTDHKLTALEVIQLMKLLKMVRQETTPKQDNLVDQVGYILLEEELGE